MIRVYDETGNVIETYEHKGEFKDVQKLLGLVGLNIARFSCYVDIATLPVFRECELEPLCQCSPILLAGSLNAFGVALTLEPRLRDC